MRRIVDGLKTRKGAASATALAVLVAVPTTIAVLHEGFPVTDVDLIAKQVWVTNGSAALAGRLNRQIEELDAAVASTNGDLDVVQRGDTAFVFSSSAGTLERVDPSFVVLTELIEIPVGATAVLGGDTLAVLDTGSGDVWAVDASQQLSLDTALDAPDAELGPGGQVAVSPDGTVFATSAADDALFTFTPGSKPVETPLPDIGQHQLAAVGETAVVLDTDANRIITATGTTIDLSSDALRIQQSGEAADAVVIATGDSLLQVPLAGGEVTTVDAGVVSPATDIDQVAAPVQLDGCMHGAWSSSPRYLFSCGDGRAEATAIPGASGGRIEFRVNRDVIALNDLDTGDTWLVDADLRLVDNWDDVTPPEEEDSEDGDEQSSETVFEDTLADRTEDNHDPVAVKDEFGFRQGRGAVLTVLDNDSDQDGDVLTISDVSMPDGFGGYSLIDGDRAIQFDPSADVRSGFSFSYQVSDGRKGVDDTRVEMIYRSPGSNNAPEEQRAAAVSVEKGQRVTYNVLADWRDPDGDDVFLADATIKGNDKVSYSPDGFIDFEHRSGQTGSREVRFVVSDGEESSVGTLRIDVKPAGSLDPVAVPDFGYSYVDEPVSIEPIENDISVSGKALRLLSILEQPDGAEVTLNTSRKTITLRSAQAGSYYVIYQLGAGPKQTQGIARFDVVENPDQPLPPVAVKDTAYLRPDQPAVVPVLANDESPSGRVLAVQSVALGDARDDIDVEVLGHQRLRITSSSSVVEQLEFGYTISDGESKSTTTVTVVPVAEVVRPQTPVAVDDEVDVRAGDIVTYDVLGNDFHPDDLPFVIEPELLQTDRLEGIGFVGDGKVRYQAPNEPGLYQATYGIVDDYQNEAVATITFNVKGGGLDGNSAPNPAPIESRVIAGETTIVHVPLDGIDPDGDSVILVGIAQAPTLGIAKTTSTTIVYKAGRSEAGTDEFQYTVQDRYGAVENGTIRIGVIPPPEQATAPVAVDDRAEVQPDSVASIDVLANDSDPNGFDIRVASELLQVDSGITAEVADNRVLVETPEAEGYYAVRYQLSNGRGGTDSALLQVHVTEDAPELYPIAHDHVIEPQDIVDRDSIDVPVLQDAANPGGRVADLEVSVEGVNANAATVLENGRIRVTPGDLQMAITYVLTNPVDGRSGKAFILVPPAQGADALFPPPYLRPALAANPPIVDMNGNASWNLEDILVVPSGKPAIITYPETVRATHSDGSSAYVDQDTIRFAGATDYRGDASVTFEVTDGISADDPTGRTATIQLPISVGDPDFEDTPPVVTARDERIAPGEDAITIDLRDSSDHPNPRILEQLQYGELRGQVGGIAAELRGSELTLSAPVDTPPGTAADLRYTVTYGDLEPVEGVVRVQVVSSTRHEPTTENDALVLKRATTATTNVLVNDYNPWKGEFPLTVIDVAIDPSSNEVGAAQVVDWTADGDVTVTSNDGIGRFTVVYVIEDATNDPDRRATGNLVVNVQDVPSKPVNAPAVTEQDRALSVQIGATDGNGAGVDYYEIDWGDGTAPQQVPTPGTYSRSGLQNGQNYSIRFRGHNVHGDGEWSDASVGNPYGKPTPPSQVTIAAAGVGTGDVAVTWSGADGNGRAITDYEIVLLRDGSAVRTVNRGSATTNYTFDLDANTSIGGSYSARVTTISAGAKGDQSTASKAPAAIPEPAPVASISASPGPQDSRRVDFSWTKPAAHNVDGYRLSGCATNNNFSGTSTSCTGSPGNTLNLTVSVLKNGRVSDSRSASAVVPQNTPAPTVGTARDGSWQAYPATCGTWSCSWPAIRWTDLPSGNYTMSWSYTSGCGYSGKSGSESVSANGSGGHRFGNGYWGCPTTSYSVRIQGNGIDISSTSTWGNASCLSTSSGCRNGP